METTLSKDILSERQLSYAFYFDQLTLLLKKSYGMPQQVKMYVDCLQLINNTEKNFFNSLGIYDNDIGRWVLNGNSDAIAIDKDASDLLDKIASIVGVSRNYAFLGEDTDGNPITLGNRDLMILIYCKVIKNNFNGTKEEIDDAYNFIRKFTDDGTNCVDISYTNSMQNSTVNVFLDSEKLSSRDENLKKLFLNGFMTFKSLGIKYSYSIVSFSDAGHYDGNPKSAINGQIQLSDTSASNKYGTARYI